MAIRTEGETVFTEFLAKNEKQITRLDSTDPATARAKLFTVVSELVRAAHAGNSAGARFFGDGSDGDVTVAGTTTLTRDMFYDDLTVTGTLKPAGFRVFVRGTLTLTGSIQSDGAAAVGKTAGGAGASGTLKTGIAGGAGGAGGAGAAGGAATNSYGGNGGAGGADGAGNAGGAAGASSEPAAALGSVRNHDAAVQGVVMGAGGVEFVQGGAGGSGGGGAGGGNEGGGGGAGGGVLMVAARKISVASPGNLSVQGGAGGTAAGANAGGGAGGGGGAVLAIYEEANHAPSSLWCIATGGDGGAKTGTGTAGAAGVDGAVIALGV